MTPENGTFRSAFRAALDRSGTSVRSLARLLAGGDADARKVESERRKLHKYLSENDEARTVPERATAARLEGLLRLEAGSLADHLEDVEAQLIDLCDEIGSVYRLYANSATEDAFRNLWLACL